MQKSIDINKDNNKRKIGACFLAVVLVLTTFSTIMVLIAPVGAGRTDCIPPVADPNGPYTGIVNETITIDGSGSYDTDGYIVTWDWDLDDDGFFDDASGEIITHSWSVPGTYIIGLSVEDNDSCYDTNCTIVTITEDETPPEQIFIIGDPNITREWRGNDYPVVGPCTPLTIVSTDDESGSNRIEYSVWIAQDLNASSIVWQHLPQYDKVVYDDDEDGTVITTFYLNETCLHEIRYQCWDNENNTEGLFSQDLFVDKCTPVTTKTVGCPSYGEGEIQPYWISDDTPLTFTAYDRCCLPNGTGVEVLHIKVWWKYDMCNISGALQLLEHIVVEDNDDNDEDVIIGQIAFPYVFHFNMSGYYELEFWSEDGMCNEENHWKQQHRVDVEPPEITKIHPDHGYMRINETHGYLKAGSEISLSAEDAPTDTCNVGLDGLYWRYEYNGEMFPNETDPTAVDGSSFWGECCPVGEDVTDYLWYSYEDAILFDEECQHDLYYFGIDKLCNYEVHHQTYYVDDTEPYAEVEYPGHGYYQDDVDYLKVNTPITIMAYDNPDNLCQADIESIFWRYELEEDLFPNEEGTGIVHGTDLVSMYGEDYDVPAITDYYWYRVDAATADVAFYEQCQHDLFFFVKDNVCHRSGFYNLSFYVDDMAPELEICYPEHGFYSELVDPPSYYRNHLKCNTSFTITATDLPDNQCAAGIETIFWRYEWNGSYFPNGPGTGIINGADLVGLYGNMYDIDEITSYYWYYTNSDSVDISFMEECYHELFFFAKDNVCQRTEIEIRDYYVDNTPPDVDLSFPLEHGYYQEWVCDGPDDEYPIHHIKCGFEFQIMGYDFPDNFCKAGIESIFWRYEWNGTSYPEEADPGCGFINGSDLVDLYGSDYDIPEITDYVWGRIDDYQIFMQFLEECEHNVFYFAKDNVCHRSEIKNKKIHVDCSEPDVWIELPGHGYQAKDDESGYLKEDTEFTIRTEDNPDNECAAGIEAIFWRYNWQGQSYPDDDPGTITGNTLVNLYGDDYDIPEITNYIWFVEYADNVSISFDIKCKHELFYFAKDNVCQRTDIMNHTFYVDDEEPFVDFMVEEGHGYYMFENDRHIKCGKNINIYAYDLPDGECNAGIESIFWRWEWNETNYPSAMDDNIIDGSDLVILYGSDYDVPEITDYLWYYTNEEEVNISFNEGCEHTLFFFAKDNVCHRTCINEVNFFVDCEGPIIELTHPDHGYMEIDETSGHLKSGAYIQFSISDMPDNECAAGIESFFYRWEWKENKYPDGPDEGVISGSELASLYGYTDPNIIDYYWYVINDDFYSLTFWENCTHELYFWAKDNVCNRGMIHHRTYLVDDEVPMIELTHPDHGYYQKLIDPPSTFWDYLKAGTTITVDATDFPQNDCGAGIESIFWRYEWNGSFFPDGAGDNIISGQRLIELYGSDYNIPDINDFWWYQVNDSTADISFMEECEHDLFIFAKDNLCHRTDIIHKHYFVDDSNPYVHITFPDHGYYPVNDLSGYLKCFTPITLTPFDLPESQCMAGIENLFWRYEFNGSLFPDGEDEGVISGSELASLYGYTDPNIVGYYWYLANGEINIEFLEECTHELYYWAKDNVCHPSQIYHRTFFVDNSPPLLELEMDGHGYYEVDEGIGHIKPYKSIWINASDEGACQAGIESIFWRYVYDGELYPSEPGEGVVSGYDLYLMYGDDYLNPDILEFLWYRVDDTSVDLWFEEECQHDLLFFGKDNVCHPTEVQHHTFLVDNSTPYIYGSPQWEHGYYPTDMKDYLKCGMPVIINAYDLPENQCAAGIESIFYRYEWNEQLFPAASGSGIVSGADLVTMYGSDYDIPEITNFLWYRVDDDHVNVSFDEECNHTIFFFAKDNVCHPSDIVYQTYYVDCSGPTVEVEHPDHGYIEIDDNSGYLKAGSMINITTTDQPENDCASGIETLFWRWEFDGQYFPEDMDDNVIDGEELPAMYGDAYDIPEITDYLWFIDEDGNLQITFFENCTHELFFFAKDNVCNRGILHHRTYYVDDEGPSVTVSYPNHGYWQELLDEPGAVIFKDYLKCGIPITLTATDFPNNNCSAGIESIFWRYEFDGGLYPSEPGSGVVSGQELVDLYGEEYLNPDILEFLWYRIDDSTAEVIFNEECIHDLYYFGKDNVCHPSEVYYNRYYVDCSEPCISITYPDHGYFEDDPYPHLKCNIALNLNAYDFQENECWAGIEGIFWRYEWNGEFYPSGEGPGVRTGAELAAAYGYTDPAIVDYDWYYTEDDFTSIMFEEECQHELYYWTKDNVCHPSDIHHKTFLVDNSEPDVSITVGEPNCIDEDCECCIEPGEYCITSDTNITISAEDMPDNQCAAGIEAIFYRYKYFNGEITLYYPDDPDDEGDIVSGSQLASWYGYTDPDILNWLWYRVNDTSVKIQFKEECQHDLYYWAKDNVCHPTDVMNKTFYVDETPPPKPLKTVGDPKVFLGLDSHGHDQWMVYPGTPICFEGFGDEGCCPCEDVTIVYRIWYLGQWTEWMNYTECIYLTRGCVHYLEAKAFDCLGNEGEVDNETFWVCAPGGGDSDPNIVFIEPTPEDEEHCEPTIHVKLEVEDQETANEDLFVLLYIPGGRRDAPTLYHYPEYNPDKYGDEYFHAFIDIYNYQDGTNITLHAMVTDEDMNTGVAIPVEVDICSTIVWDQWMQHGWNSLTIPYGGIACNETVKGALASIDGHYDTVFYYNETTYMWENYVEGAPWNPLEKLEEGKVYWVHITSGGLRYYTDTEGPYTEITIPDNEEEFEADSGQPGILEVYATDTETDIAEVLIKIQDHNGSYFDGSVWQDDEKWLTCDLYVPDYWQYYTYGIWAAEHTYNIMARAYDSSGCFGEDAITFSILPEQEEEMPEGSGATIDPDYLEITLIPGQSITEHKNVTTDLIPIGKLDVLFLFDLTSSMSDDITDIKTEASNIMNDISVLVNDSAFGVGSFMDYVGYYDYCGYYNEYGYNFSGDYPWNLDLDITTDTTVVNSTINGLVMGSGADSPESYTRALYESQFVSWRAGARKVVIIFEDNDPHDCNLSEFGCGYDTGVDPGRDAVAGTSDDLTWIDVTSQLKAADISVVAIEADFGYCQEPWLYLTNETGGIFAEVGSTDNLAEEIVDLIENITATISHLTLEPRAGFEDWFEWTPEFYTDVEGGVTVEFDVTITVPEETSPGVYHTWLMVIGDGSILDVQELWITVEECLNIVEMAISQNPDEFNTLVEAVVAAGLDEVLSNESLEFTVFAPTDEAFAALDPEFLQNLIENDTDNLTEILTYHVVPGTYLSTDLFDGMTLTTVQGEDLLITIDGDVFVNDATVILPDILCCNGVIHVINAVLIPPEEEELMPSINISKKVRNETLGWVEDPDILTVNIGDTLTYNLTIHNDGDCNLSAINITDILPYSNSYIVASAMVTTNGVTSQIEPDTWGDNNLSWNFCCLDVDQWIFIEFEATAGEPMTDGETNTAVASGYCSDTITDVNDSDFVGIYSYNMFT